MTDDITEQITARAQLQEYVPRKHLSQRGFIAMCGSQECPVLLKVEHPIDVWLGPSGSSQLRAAGFKASVLRDLSR